MGGGTNVGDGNFGPGLFVDRGEVASTLIGALVNFAMAANESLHISADMNECLQTISGKN